MNRDHRMIRYRFPNPRSDLDPRTQSPERIATDLAISLGVYYYRRRAPTTTLEITPLYIDNTLRSVDQHARWNHEKINDLIRQLTRRVIVAAALPARSPPGD